MSTSGSVWRTFLASLRKPTYDVVGRDKVGNVYYRNVIGGRERRQVLAEGKGMEERKPEDYVATDLPPQWEAWLRGRRVDPPTEEEIMLSDARQAEIKRRADVLAEKDRLLRIEEGRPSLEPPGIDASELAPGARIGGSMHVSGKKFGKKRVDKTRPMETMSSGAWEARQKEQDEVASIPTVRSVNIPVPKPAAGTGTGAGGEGSDYQPEAWDFESLSGDGERNGQQRK